MEELLKESLREDEKLLWSGRPEAFETLDKTHKSPFIRSGIIAAVVTIALCVAYVILAKAKDVPLKPAVLVIVAACGIFIILRGLLDASKIRKRACYAITDKRLIILTDSAKSVEYSAIIAAKLDRDEDGHTSLLCGEDAIKARPWKRRAAVLSGAITNENTGMCERFVMYALPDADKIKEILKPYLPL
ncbi:MAG: hypothetical protein ACI3VA_06920 [Candidatus Limivicinus sp.]